MRYVIELERDPNGRPLGRVVSDAIENGGEFVGWFELLALLGDADSTGTSGDDGVSQPSRPSRPATRKPRFAVLEHRQD
jgi:hypothetical protein